MRIRILGALLFALGALFCVRAPAHAANGSCVNTPLVGPTVAALQNASNLQCDANGNLLVTNQAGTYNAAYGQAALLNSFRGLAGWSVLGGGAGVDALVDGPAGGPSTGPSAGQGIALGTPGILYVQGIGPNGTVPIFSSTGFPISDITLTHNAAVNNNALVVGGMITGTSTPEPLQLDTSTYYLQVDCKSGCGGSTTFPYTGTSNGQTATSASFLGAGGLYNTSLPTLTNTQFSPLQLDASGRLIMNCATGCSGSTTYPYSGTTSGQTATTASFLGAGGLYNTSAPTLTNTQFSPFQLDASGNLNVNVKAGGGSTTFPYSGTSSGQTATTASFLGAAGVYNSSPPTLTNTQAAPIQLDVSGNQKVNVAAGTVAATQSGTWNIGSITTLPALVAGSAIVGKVGIDQTTPGTTNGVQVNAALPAGTNNIGITTSQVQSYTGTSTLTPTVTSGAYTAGFVMGGLLSFTSALRSTDYSGILESISIASKTTTTSGMSMCFFNANPTSSTFTDHGAPSLNAADNAKLLGCTTLGAPTSVIGTGTTWTLPGIGLMVNNSASSTTLYGVLVTTAGYTTGTTSDLTIALGILQD